MMCLTRKREDHRINQFRSHTKLSIMVTIRTTFSTTSLHFPQAVYLCVPHVPQSIVVSSVSIIYRLVFMKERQCVYCEVGTDLPTHQTKLMHRRFKKIRRESRDWNHLAQDREQCHRVNEHSGFLKD
jgi:hypothetical protein